MKDQRVKSPNWRPGKSYEPLLLLSCMKQIPGGFGACSHRTGLVIKSLPSGTSGCRQASPQCANCQHYKHAPLVVGLRMDTKISGRESVTNIFPGLPRASEELGGASRTGPHSALRDGSSLGVATDGQVVQGGGLTSGAAPGLPLCNIRPSVCISISQTCNLHTTFIRFAISYIPSVSLFFIRVFLLLQ